MSKNKRNYIISWLLLVALFNTICFATPAELNGLNKFLGGFWPGYGFIMVTFIIHLVFIWHTIENVAENKKVLNMPIIVISFMELFIMVLSGGLCMALPFVPYWIGIVICAVILTLSIVFTLTARIAGENAIVANSTLNKRVSLFRDITAEAEMLLKRIDENEKGIYIKKIVDAFRYSDPMTDESSISDELEIRKKLKEIIKKIDDIEKEELSQRTDELLRIIDSRNANIKNHKRRRVN